MFLVITQGISIWISEQQLKHPHLWHAGPVLLYQYHIYIEVTIECHYYEREVGNSLHYAGDCTGSKPHMQWTLQLKSFNLVNNK